MPIPQSGCRGSPRTDVRLFDPACRMAAATVVPAATVISRPSSVMDSVWLNPSTPAISACYRSVKAPYDLCTLACIYAMVSPSSPAKVQSMTKRVEMISSFPNVDPGDSVKIAVVGCGYVGLVAAVCFAEIGHKVICVDNDGAKIAALQSGQIPIHEDHLEQLLRRQKKEALTFSTSLADAVRASEAVFIAVGTPPMENGDADLSYVEAVAVEIARSIQGYRVIVEKSTVPVYTSDWISRVLHRHGVAHDEADVVSNPEFLREGTAVRDFLHPDRIVVGTGSDHAFRVLSRIYRPLTDGSYYRKESSLTGPCNDLLPPPLV